MNTAQRIAGLALVALLAAPVSIPPALAADDVEAISSDLTLIFRAARKMISDSQDLILRDQADRAQGLRA